MIEWTPEAEEHLETYLQRVGVLSRQQGDDADEIVSELREHIARESEADAGALVTLDHLQKVLAAVGTPEQVTETECRTATRSDTQGTEQIKPTPQRVTNVYPPRKPISLKWPCLIVGMIVSVPIFLVLLAIGLQVFAIVVPSMQRNKEEVKRKVCETQLAHIYAYLDLNLRRGELFPPLSSKPGRWMFDQEVVFPDALMEPSFNVCPGDPKFDDKKNLDTATEDDCSYIYLGYALTSEEDAKEFLEIYAEKYNEKDAFTKDLTTSNGKTLYRLREDAPDNVSGPDWDLSKIPVFFEHPRNHKMWGGNVVYLDGHVGFVEMDKFPMIQQFLNGLDAIEERFVDKEGGN